MTKSRIKGKDGWYKDEKSGTIFCSDKARYEKYMKSYRADQQKQQQFETLQNEVSELKSDMSDIKSLLLTLVQNQKGLKDYDD